MDPERKAAFEEFMARQADRDGRQKRLRGRPAPFLASGPSSALLLSRSRRHRVRRGPRAAEATRGRVRGGRGRRTAAGQTASVTGAFTVAASSPSAGASAAFGPAPFSGTSFTKTAATRASTATAEPSRNAPWVPEETAC